MAQPHNQKSLQPFFFTNMFSYSYDYGEAFDVDEDYDSDGWTPQKASQTDSAGGKLRRSQRKRRPRKRVLPAVTISDEEGGSQANNTTVGEEPNLDEGMGKCWCVGVLWFALTVDWVQMLIPFILVY